MLRPLFLSHGAPTLPFEDVAARHFLAGLAATMPRPRAILVVSAHWETRLPTVNAVTRNETIHDFRGFPAGLYQLAYPAPGDPALAERVVDLLAEAGLTAAIDPARGLDHGAWVPLMLAWPDAGIPVVQLSVQSHLGPGHHLELGRAQGRTCDLLAYRNLAPHAARNHPTEEHLLPLFVALGAAGPHPASEHLHASQTHGVLRMDAFAFGKPI